MTANTQDTEELKPTLDEVHAFLLGTGSLDGCWFGDDTRPPFTSSRPYWWREHLRKAIASRPDSPVTVMREAGKALLAMLDEAFPFGDAIGRPTIAELEAMLASKAPGSIEIRPNGSIHVVPREEIEAFREALARISR